MRANSNLTYSLLSAWLIAATLIAIPPRVASSQESDTPRVKRPIVVDTTYTSPVVERIADKTEELKELTKDIGSSTQATLKQVGKLDKAVDKLAGSLKEQDKADTVIVPITDTCYLPGEPIFVRDTSLDGKTWWGKFLATNKRMLDQCKLHRLKVRIGFTKKIKHAE